MNNLCNKCGLCCKLIPAYNNKIIRDGFQPVEDMFVPISINTALDINENYVKKVQNLFPDAEFFSCRYLSDDNLCTHPNPPETCKTFPQTALAIIDDNCSYLGEIFIKHEKLKQKIRRLKEEILHYEILKEQNPKEKNNYEKIINSHKGFIKRYSEFGSGDW